MRKTGTRVGLITIFLFVVAGFSTAAIAAEKVYKWKLQSHLPAASPSYSGSVLVMVENVKKATGGRLIIEPFPSGSLVPSKEIYNAVARGMIPMGVTSGGYHQNRVPLLSVTGGLPYSFRDVKEALYFHDFLGFEQMVKDACKKDGIFYATDNVYGTEMVFKKPIRTLQDLKGLKVRSYGAISTFLGSIGAAPTYLPGSEIYPALASGVVEGAHWGAAQGARDMGFYDVCKYHMKPALAISGQTCFLVNQKALNKLPKDIQKALTTVLDNHHLKRPIEYAMLEDLALAEVQKTKGVTVITLAPEVQKQITALAMKMWEKEAAKSPENRKAVDIMIAFLKKLGHI